MYIDRNVLYYSSNSVVANNMSDLVLKLSITIYLIICNDQKSVESYSNYTHYKIYERRLHHRDQIHLGLPPMSQNGQIN